MPVPIPMNSALANARETASSVPIFLVSSQLYGRFSRVHPPVMTTLPTEKISTLTLGRLKLYKVPDGEWTCPDCVRLLFVCCAFQAFYRRRRAVAVQVAF
jgi:hypothetical protein